MARPRTFAALALGAALLALPAPAALAADSSTYSGECGFLAVATTPGPGTSAYEGTIDAQVVVYSSTHGNVVNATVTCEIRVNGVVQDTASGSGAGLVVVADTLSFTAADDAYVDVCTVVDFTSDWTPTSVDCGGAVTPEFPPEWVRNAGNYVWYTVDPYACEALKAAAPGAGPVVVDGQGDVYVNGDFVYDCPPYEFPAPPPSYPLPPVQPATLSGGGHNDGSTGFLTLFPPGAGAPSLVSTCAFTTSNGVATVVGRTDAPGASEAGIQCRLEDAVTGAVLYDNGAASTAGSASIQGTAAVTGPVTVCTTGSASFAAGVQTVGRECRPGVPV